jgi:hypothetical protein
MSPPPGIEGALAVLTMVFVGVAAGPTTVFELTGVEAGGTAGAFGAGSRRGSLFAGLLLL